MQDIALSHVDGDPHFREKTPSPSGHVNVVGDSDFGNTPFSRSIASTAALRVRFHGISMRLGGVIGRVVLKRMVSPSLLQSTRVCRSCEMSSRCRSSMSHILVSTSRMDAIALLVS